MENSKVIDQLTEYVHKISPKLMQRFEKREKILLMARELIRLSGETISLCHRGKSEEARKKFEEARKKSKDILEIIEAFPDLLYGDVGTSFQELAEADIVMAVECGAGLYLPEELGIPDTHFITGIADAVGEIRRMVLENLKRRDTTKADQLYSQMESIYQLLWEMEYPKPVVPSLRQKIDFMRKVLEETNHDIFLAKLSIS